MYDCVGINDYYNLSLHTVVVVVGGWALECIIQ